jgi:hypothetical protein
MIRHENSLKFFWGSASSTEEDELRPDCRKALGISESLVLLCDSATLKEVTLYRLLKAIMAAARIIALIAWAGLPFCGDHARL